MKTRLLTIFAIAAAGLLFAAAGPASAVEVEVKFGPKLAKALPQINSLEKSREVQFRKHRQYKRTSFNNSRRLAFARWPDVDWANEVVVPNIDDFSVGALTRGLVKTSLERAGVDEVEKVVVEIDRLHVQNYSLVTIAGPNSYATGTITAYGAGGNVIGSASLTADLTVDFLSAPRYDGNNFAFPDISRQLRVGPVISYFIQKGLGIIYRDREFARTVLITF